MPYAIDIDTLTAVPDDAISRLETAVSTALDQLHSAPNASLAIILADDVYLQALNVQFRQEDHPTDVLSFPAGEPMPGMPEDLLYLGDIAISVPYAQRQAGRQGHSVEDEIQLLGVHGVLHLLGYDHTDDVEKAAMWQQQQLILDQLGLGHVQPTETDGGS